MGSGVLACRSETSVDDAPVVVSREPANRTTKLDSGSVVTEIMSYSPSVARFGCTAQSKRASNPTLCIAHLRLHPRRAIQCPRSHWLPDAHSDAK